MCSASGSKEATDEGYQRFLNVRFRACGLDTIKPRMAEISAAIEADTPFRVRKTISEWVWHDTMPELDHGWIDFAPEEWAALEAAPKA